MIDGYLSAGALGVFVTCVILGLVASWTSRFAEAWFGGYIIGGQVVYTSLFNSLVLVNSFEFMTNSVFWSFVLMMMLFLGLRVFGILQPAGVPAGMKPPPSR